MSFLFDKCRKAAKEIAKVLAKKRIFAKNPRQIQFENDINRLFLYTSCSRLGCHPIEGGAEEIIQMGNQTSIEDQHDQVQENVHSQIKAFCFSVDHLLRPNLAKAGDTPEMNATCRRLSGVGFAVGSTTSPAANIGAALTEEENPEVTKSELSRGLKTRIGFTLELKPSHIRHREAGRGLFISGEAGIGSVVAIYPGVVYSPSNYRYIPGYPKIGRGNPYLITRYDGAVINARPWGTGGDALEAWDGSADSGHRSEAAEAGSDRLWRFLSAPLDGLGRGGGGGGGGGSGGGGGVALVERRNPLALAHFANHPPEGAAPNVMVCPYDFPLAETSLRRHIPNTVFREGGGAEMKRLGAFWFRSWGPPESAAAPVLKTVVLVASRAVADEEVLLDYRLSNPNQRPGWYVPVDPEAEHRRWG